jgi:hypothetical protein
MDVVYIVIYNKNQFISIDQHTPSTKISLEIIEIIHSRLHHIVPGFSLFGLGLGFQF